MKDFKAIIQKVQESTKKMAKDMKNVEDELVDVKKLFEFTNKLVVDNKCQVGVKKVEEAFQKYVAGSENLSTTFKILESSMVEIQTMSIQNIIPDKIFAYLDAIKQTEENDVCEQLFRYAIIVLVKYLLINTTYNILKREPEKVAAEFENFNRIYGQLLDGFQKVFRT